MADVIKTILTADSTDLESKLTKAASRAEGFEKKMAGLVVTIGSVVGADRVLSAFNSIRNSIDQLNDQAARLEMPVEEMQRLNAVSTMSGASVETLAKALNKSYFNAVEAAGGNKELRASFAALNIDAAAFLAATPTERLVQLSNGFNGAANKGEAFAAVFKVMGKGAAELIPMLRDGEAGIEAISRRLQVLGSEDVAAIASLNDEIDLLASNVKTELAGAFITLRPQIESIVKALAEAAEGLSVFLDPAKGAGKQGGVLGGAQMLREIDQLQPKIAELKNQLAGKSWWEGTGDLKLSLKNSEAAVAALQTRFAGLSQSAQLYAAQLNAAERLQGSLSGEALEEELAKLQSRTTETAKAAQAERELATAAAASAGQIAEQEASAAKLAKTLEGLESKVGGRIVAMQTPEKRQEFAKKELGEILTNENAGSVDELRRRVGTAPDDASRVKSLQALDAALEKMDQIQRASGEIAAKDQTRYDGWAAQMDREAAAREQLEKAAEKAAEREADADARRSAALKSAQTELSILQTTLDLGAEKGEQLREQIEMKDAAAKAAEGDATAEGNILAVLQKQALVREAISKIPAGGTIKSRREDRSEARAADRQANRDDAVREAAANRESMKGKTAMERAALAQEKRESKRAAEAAERAEKRDGKQGLKPKADIDQRKADAAGKADEGAKKKGEKLTNLVEKIEGYMKNLTAA